MLSIARRLAPFNVPLIGINQGRLGFLTDIPIAEHGSTLDAMLSGSYIEERRTLLDAEVVRADGARESAFALNDVVLNRGGGGTMIECSVEIDGRFVYAMRADGIIVATPTGSTAYALSAGGPILDPQVPAFALVPVAPHALTHRPIAVADTSTIAIRLERGRDAALHCDGQAHFALAEGERITVRRAPYARAFSIPKVTTTSRCCARSCTGAKRPSACAGTDRTPEVVMLRLLSIRNFVVVEALDLELDAGFSVLTGETGAGKSILLDALGLLLGDRFELRQLKPGAERAELAAAFDVAERPRHRRVARRAGTWTADDDGPLLLRRTLDREGRSRAWINGRPATLAQLKEIGETLVDLHGQHAHQSLTVAEAQRALVDAFGGFTALVRETGSAWRDWRAAAEKREAAAQAALRRPPSASCWNRAGASSRALERLGRRVGVAVATPVATRARRGAPRGGGDRRRRAVRRRRRARTAYCRR